ncbi:DNA-3-methyladenine glycosylase family protein [Sediminibacillus massiliensis]|uniref:DNA-3-methyladenine glycosylase family protein n=1 Tax=Sediminibacillus massiliensis TaxID=1926277 RepID=UPI00098843AE|nr:DNA-3-methyladenine glycosylase [Sediminibacillus massiliensis]
MWTEKIELTSIYDFDYILNRSTMEPLKRLDMEQRTIWIPVEIADEKHVVKVHGKGSIQEPKFAISSDSIAARDALISEVGNVLQWDVDFTSINEHFIGTNLEKLFFAHPGTPIVKDHGLYFSLIKGIIHQQLNMKFAHTLDARFVQKYGGQHEQVWFYPRPETVARLSYEDLRELQFSQRKAEYVIDTSRKIVNGELDLEQLATASDQEVIDTLIKLRGIGRWTAENWLLFGLGRSNLLPKADIGIQNAMKFYFELGRKPSIQEIEEMSETWTPYQSYASMTLWRSIE